MKALLLAGGLGTRLRPLTDRIPKCMAPIRGKPLLGHWFDLLFPASIDRALVNTHYLPEPVRRFVADSPWRSRVDLVHEAELLGTGGTILANRAYFEDGPFMVVHADNLTRFDVGAFLARHAGRPAGCEITMMTFVTDAPQSCGIVEEDDRGVITGFFEKVANPPGNHANGAVYIFEPSVIGDLATLGKAVIDLSTEVLPRYVGRMCGYLNDDYHRDIGTPESLAKAEAEFHSSPKEGS